EGRVDVRDTRRNVLTFATANACGFLGHGSPFNDIFAAVVPAATPMKAAGSGQSAMVSLLPAADCPLPQLLLLAGNRLGRTLAGAGVRLRALAANRQRAAMAQATVAAEVHEALDVHR